MVAVLAHAALILFGYADLDRLSLFGEAKLLITRVRGHAQRVLRGRHHRRARAAGASARCARRCRTSSGSACTCPATRCCCWASATSSRTASSSSGRARCAPGGSRSTCSCSRCWCGAGSWRRCGSTCATGSRVADVVAESPDTISVYLTGERLDRLDVLGWTVLPLAVPGPRQLVAVAPVLGLGRAQRALAAADRQGGRRAHQRPARPANRAPGSGRTGRRARSPPPTARASGRCSSPAASASRRSARCSRSCRRARR